MLNAKGRSTMFGDRLQKDYLRKGEIKAFKIQDVSWNRRVLMDLLPELLAFLPSTVDLTRSFGLC